MKLAGSYPMNVLSRSTGFSWQRQPPEMMGSMAAQQVGVTWPPQQPPRASLSAGSCALIMDSAWSGVTSAPMAAVWLAMSSVDSPAVALGEMPVAPAAMTVLWQAWSHPVQGRRLMMAEGSSRLRELGSRLSQLLASWHDTEAAPNIITTRAASIILFIFISLLPIERKYGCVCALSLSLSFQCKVGRRR